MALARMASLTSCSSALYSWSKWELHWPSVIDVARLKKVAGGSAAVFFVCWKVTRLVYIDVLLQTAPINSLDWKDGA